MKKKLVAGLVALGPLAPQVNASTQTVALTSPSLHHEILIFTDRKDVLSWLRDFAKMRGLEVQTLEVLEPPIALSTSSDSRSHALADELRIILGDAATVRVVAPGLMQLATQAGGRPGR